MNKLTKIIDVIMRIVFLAIFIPGGFYALFTPVEYAKGWGMTMDQPMGRGEVSVVGGAYLLASIILLYNWFKKNNSEIYKAPAFLITAILLSRFVSIIYGDYDETLLYIFFIEIILIIWAVLGLKRNIKPTP